MKLWTKTLIGVGSVGVLAGGVAGGLYGYSKSDASKGSAHYSARGTNNNLADFKNVLSYKAELRDPNNTNVKVADYDIATDTIGGVDAQQWVEDYIQKNQSVPPEMVVQAGPIEFQNFYPEVVLPKDFVNFIVWYSTNVPWTTDMSSMSFFRIKRGIQYGEDGRSLTLGDYAAEKQTKKRIRFMPDSFFGQVDANSLFRDYSNVGFSKEQLVKFIEDVNTTNKEIVGEASDPEHVDKNALVKIYSIAKRNGLYYPSLATPGDGIFKIDKKAPFLKKKVSDVDVQVDLETGETTISDKPSYKVLWTEEIPKLTVWRALAEDGKWDGIDIEWLKYVTHHEYGHMQTMGMVSDAATSPVQLSVSSNASPTYGSVGQQYDLDELNRYLEARATQIKAVRVKVFPKIEGNEVGFDYYDDDLDAWEALSDDEKKKTPKPIARDYSNIAFEYAGDKTFTKETFEDIFGSNVDLKNPEKAPYKINVDDLISDVNSGKNPRFFMQTVSNLRAFAKQLDIPMYDVVLMNAFDNFIATTSPHITTSVSDAHPVKTMMYMVKDDAKGYIWADASTALSSLKDQNGEKLILPTMKKAVEPAVTAPNGKVFHPSDGDTYTFFLKVMQLLGKVPKSEPTITIEGQIFEINPKAVDAEGNLITDNKDAFIEWFNTNILPNANSGIQGRKDLLGGAKISGSPELIANDADSAKAFKADSGIKTWMANPAYSSSADLGSLFSDYNYLFPEVLTRDWLQMSMVQDDIVGKDGTTVEEKTGEFTKTGGFKYQSKFGNVNAENTGLELYVDPSAFLPKEYMSFAKLGQEGFVDTYGIKSSIQNGLRKLFTAATFPGHSLTMNKDIPKGQEWKYWEPTLNAKIDYNRLKDEQDFSNIALERADMTNYFGTMKYGLLKGDWNVNGNIVDGTASPTDFAGLLFAWDDFTNVQSMNNGWSQDRWLRSSLTNTEDKTETGTEDSWTLYDNNGDPLPLADKGSKIKEIIKDEDSDHDGLVDNRVRAFWNFFIQARGIGSRTVAKIWRVPDRDAFAMWGYVTLEDAKNIKYVQFKNKETGEVHYEKIRTGEVTTEAGKTVVKNPVDNLFYYEHQADATTKHTLEQDGYTGWTIDYLSMGTWFDSDLQNGQWEMDFVDENHEEVMRADDSSKRLMSLGESSDQMDHKDYITENGIGQAFAPVYIQRTKDEVTNKENGLPLMIVKDQFPI